MRQNYPLQAIFVRSGRKSVLYRLRLIFFLTCALLASCEPSNLTSKAPSRYVELDVPFLSQLENEKNPYATSNVTAIAMVLSHYGVQPRKRKRLPDELYDWIELNGLAQYDPFDLAKLVNEYGLKDKFRTNATLDEIKDELGQGHPVIVAGFFLPVGHYICIIGYTPTGFIVHDPYGYGLGKGYDLNTPNNSKGKRIFYPYKFVEEKTDAANGVWAHFISP